MKAPFQLTPQAAEDLDAIWRFIAEDNRDAADRVETEIRHELPIASLDGALSRAAPAASINAVQA
jgi:plasmid stabilization system protein ParE